MFNVGLFNRQPFNTRAVTANVLTIRGAASERLVGAVGSGLIFNIHGQFDEYLVASVVHARGVPVKSVLLEQLAGKVESVASFGIRTVVKETLSGSVLQGAAVQVFGDFSEGLTGRITIGAVVHLMRAVAETLRTTSVTGAVVSVGNNLLEFLSGYVSTINIEEIVCDLNVVIPPGGVLVVDSDVFTAVLNNTDVIDKHSEDWIYVSRELTNVELVLIGDTEMEVFYIARYL